ncbi:sugar ABC transporter ATP-binding protein [Nocardioides sp. J54]|uniref:sugar ABC transporter ATP-binding protein n=1 Tax=Nocardioides sp. J54 TaxID=935866 RepID=UPI00048B43FB|nr:sugar ABC transporter ATP-binding protein [Nocardioides sp. J54]
MTNQNEPGRETSRPGPLLRVRDAVKDYPGTRALDHLDFSLDAGEVHALLGENGAGKSTLIKALAGALQLTSGSIEVDGTAVDVRNPQRAQALGISVVHQHGNLVPELSVTENVLMVEGLDRRAGILVGWRGAHQRTRELLDRVGLPHLDPRTEVADLGAHEQAMVAVAKALASNARVIILDEPTTSLQPAEVDTLFAQMRRLAAEGIGFVFVTHRLNEVFKVCDRITVMRDGGLVGTWLAADLDHDSLVDQLVGAERAIAHEAFTATAPPGDVVLDVRGLRGDVLRGLDLQARAGEVVGIASLPGEGAGEVVESLYGLRRAEGEVTIDGRRARVRNPQQAVAAGMALVPRDRLGQGLVSELSIRENATLATTRSYTTDPVLRLMRKGRERSEVAEVMAQLSLKSGGLESEVRTLSGGNQQKVVIGRWLLSDARVLLLDSPTAAVDVHTKAEIYALARSLADNGAAVIFTSTELEEFVRVCDRVLVLHDGGVVGELAGEEITVNSIMRLSFGRKSV